MTDNFHPGDILMIPDEGGRWGKAYEYIGPDQHVAGRILVCEVGNRSSVFSARPEKMLRPAVVRDDSETEPAAEDSPHGTESGNEQGITNAQRRCLFALARSRGLDTDDLRAMTPDGHISRLTRVEAAAIITRLGGSDGHQVGAGFTAQGTATAKQLGMIAWLRDQIGFTPEQFRHWMAKRFNVQGMEEITDRSLASRVIGGLLRMQAARSAEHNDDPEGHRQRRSEANAAG